MELKATFHTVRAVIDIGARLKDFFESVHIWDMIFPICPFLAPT
jgi:hypothetical protein